MQGDGDDGAAYFGLGAAAPDSGVLGCWTVAAEESDFLARKKESGQRFDDLAVRIIGGGDLESSGGALVVTANAFIFEGEVSGAAWQGLFPSEHIEGVELSVDEDVGTVFISLRNAREDWVEMVVSLPGADSSTRAHSLNDALQAMRHAQDEEQQQMQLQNATRRRKKSKSRRASISLEDMTSLIAEADQANDDDTEDVNHQADVQQQQQQDPPVKDDDDDHTSRVRQLVRAIARVADSAAGADARAQLHASYAYEVTSVRTPTKARVADSPPTNREPQRAEVRFLRPFVKKMAAETAAERSRIEQAIRAQIRSPKNGARGIGYVDSGSQAPLSPSEYAQRYMRFVTRGEAHEPAPPAAEPAAAAAAAEAAAQPSPHELAAERSPPPPPPSGRRRAGAFRVSPSARPAAAVVVATQDVDESLAAALAAAEQRMHAAFDVALADYMTTKRQLLRDFGVSGAPPLAPLLPVSEARVPSKTQQSKASSCKENCKENSAENSAAPSQQQERKAKASRAARRKSIGFEDVLELMDDDEGNEDASAPASSSKRVVWTAR